MYCMLLVKHRQSKHSCNDTSFIAKLVLFHLSYRCIVNLLELIKNFTDNKSKSQVHMLCYYHDYSTVYVILDLYIHVHIYYHLKTYSRSSAVFNAFLSGVPFVSVLSILTSRKRIKKLFFICLNMVSILDFLKYVLKQHLISIFLR